MAQVNNSQMLMIIRFIISLPLIITIVVSIGLWDYLVVDLIWSFSTISVIALVTLFLLSRARVPESFSSYQHAEHYVKEARVHRDVFTIPVVCPICKTPIRLDEVGWQDQHTLMCQECYSKIDVTVT